GGLSKGVDLDRIPDKGPEYLWDPNAVVDDSLMKLCILRTQRKMNLFWTQDAILVVKQPQPALIQGNKKTFNFRVGLSKKDEFKEASAHKIKVTSNNNNSTLITKISLDAKEIKKFSFPILRASIQFGDNNGPNDIVIAHLSPESDLNITLRGPSEPHLIIKTHAIATNQVGLEIQFTDPTKFPTPPKIKIYAYDFGTDADGNNLRDGKFGPNRVLAENTLTFAGGNQTDITGPAITADWSPLPISGFDRALSMQDLPKDGENPGDIQCNSGKNLAFATTDWNKDFSKSTRTSRIFNPPPLGEDLIFPDQAPEKDFHVYSIVKGKCVIKSPASVVAGFLTCNLLKIESRNSPLWIIGTVIAGSLDIAPEAIKAGIFWSNIYHPSAQSLLRAKGILKSTDGSACQDVPLEPFWSPVADSNLFAKMYSCLPIALLTADPFMWTTVDPVCGLEQGSSAVVCKIKNRPLNFLGVDFARWSTL
ncbi:hypothetical protein HZA26_02300, partial [Candidatus Nomurabacteria bacterium]|nr:hypothetical protein [Candidatus Nomurabacteria bacterium]